MIQCTNCEYYSTEPDGRRVFRCDPFVNIKEPECLLKWQLLRLDMLVSSSRSMSLWQEKMAPMQEKLFKYVKRELDDIDESDKWKMEDGYDDPDHTDPDNPGEPPDRLY
jgi:hypothetical protein